MDVIWSILESLSFEPITFMAQICIFMTMHVLLSALIYDPIMKTRKIRDAHFEEHLRKAKILSKKAAEVQEKYEDGVTLERREGRRLYDEAVSASQKDYENIVGEARAEALAMVASAKEKADKAREQAESELDSRSETLASTMVTSLVLNNIESKEQQRELIAHLGGDSL